MKRNRMGAGYYLVARCSFSNPAPYPLVLRPILPLPLLPDYALVVWSLLALLVGRYFGPKLHLAPVGRGGQRLSNVAGTYALVMLFGAVALALIYEGVGVTEAALHGTSQLQQLEPITQYVRRAVYYDKLSSVGQIGIWSYAAFAITGFLVGHWLWPVRPPRNRSAGAVDPEPQPLLSLSLAALVTLVIAVGLVWGSGILLGLAFGATPELQTLAAARTGDSFREGVTIVTLFVFGVFFLMSVLDLAFAYLRWDSVGLRLERWSRSSAWFVFLLVGLLSTLVVHFVGNKIQY